MIGIIVQQQLLHGLGGGLAQGIQLRVTGYPLLVPLFQHRGSCLGIRRALDAPEDGRHLLEALALPIQQGSVFLIRYAVGDRLALLHQLRRRCHVGYLGQGRRQLRYPLRMGSCRGIGPVEGRHGLLFLLAACIVVVHHPIYHSQGAETHIPFRSLQGHSLLQQGLQSRRCRLRRGAILHLPQHSRHRRRIGQDCIVQRHELLRRSRRPLRRGRLLRLCCPGSRRCQEYRRYNGLHKHPSFYTTFCRLQEKSATKMHHPTLFPAFAL